MNITDYVGAIQSTTVPPQGMTSSVVIITSDHGEFVVKRSDRAPFTTWLSREARILQGLENSTLPIPRCLAFDVDADSTSLLMTLLPGEPLSELLCRGVSVEMRHELLKQFGQMLSRIHATPPPATVRVSKPWLSRILEEAQRNLVQGYAEPDAPPVDHLATALPEPTAEVLIHGDYTIDNVLVDAGKITGIIDWGRADSGDRRYDLALATRAQTVEAVFLEESDFQAFYAGYNGKRLTESEFYWFRALYEYF
jgi:aminoglycoside phosphotransferase (APT) family kinase protein